MPRENKNNLLTKKAFDKLTPRDEYILINQFNTLIENVKIYDWKTDFTYYELFYKHAKIYENARGKECPHIRFFSYMPKYSELNKSQLEWYLWWRDNIKRGIYLSTDSTYILLFIYELLNLTTKETAEENLNILIGIWSYYSEIYPQLNKVLGEWICDFSVIHNIKIQFPNKQIRQEMLDNVTIPEILFNFDFSDSDHVSAFLLTYCNTYNYEKSKFYNEETKGVYDKYILETVRYLVCLGLIKMDLITNIECKTNIRTSYVSALCTQKTKKRIEISYKPISSALNLKYQISDIVKYTENKIRAFLQIRSRLTVKNINQNIKSTIDRYFASIYEKEGNDSFNEYEKLYIAPQEPLSISKAKIIEDNSWEITERLVDAFSEEEKIDDLTEMPKFDFSREISLCGTNDNKAENFKNAIKDYYELFQYIKEENEIKQKEYAKRNGVVLDAVTDEINDLAVEFLDDIIIEDADSGYKIIDEYKSLF